MGSDAIGRAEEDVSGGRDVLLVVAELVDVAVAVVEEEGGLLPSEGTSRLECLAPPRLAKVASPPRLGLLTWMGKRVTGGSTDLSRRWAEGRPLAWGAGLLLRDLLAMARARASMLARRLLSSVEMARLRVGSGTLAPEGV